MVHAVVHRGALDEGGMSRGSSLTTQMMPCVALDDWQISHRSSLGVVEAARAEAHRFPLTSAMASEARSAVALSALRIQYAIRCADFGPHARQAPKLVEQFRNGRRSVHDRDSLPNLVT